VKIEKEMDPPVRALGMSGVKSQSVARRMAEEDSAFSRNIRREVATCSLCPSESNSYGRHGNELRRRKETPLIGTTARKPWLYSDE